MAVKKACVDIFGEFFVLAVSFEAGGGLASFLVRLDEVVLLEVATHEEDFLTGLFL